MSLHLTSQQPETESEVLAQNLEALSRSNPRAAAAVHAANSAPLEWIETDDGSLSATLHGRALASKRRPLDEAATFAKRLEIRKHGSAAITGFALGHHVRAVAERFAEHGVTIVYEPDPAILRAALQRIDHSSWLLRPNVRILVGDDGPGAIHAALKGHEGFVSLGVQLMPHVPSTARIGQRGEQFTRDLTQVISAMRTVIATTMIQAEVTIRNTLMNLDHALARPGIAELENLCPGCPAVVVSAGPSLKRNIELLKQPGIRDRVVIIAVQTTLRPLLDAGIKPHFVTALDYHEISKRFYDGLTTESLEGVQLVAEPKANPAILDAFPGDKRVSGDWFIETLLGEDLQTGNPKITPGATVAHLAYYLARWLGADPVILMGQDLAFTDGQYYAAGAAIHDTWAGELNTFNSIERLEWERIVRMRPTLQHRTDHLGRPVYTDQQMATYLAQFERDFLSDSERGLTTIDATEGGVAKSHTLTRPLEHALAEHANTTRPEIGAIPAAPASLEGDRLAKVLERIESVRKDVRTIARRSTETIDLLEQVKKHQSNRPRANRLIDKIDTIKEEVQSLTPAFALIQKLNQLGSFKRFRADRELRIDLAEQDLTPDEEQLRRLDRDIVNVGWIKEAADTLDDLLASAAAAAQGGEKRTRDRVLEQSIDDAALGGGTSAAPATMTAVVFVHATDLAGRDFDAGRNAEGEAILRRTLGRLAASKAVTRAIVAIDSDADTERVRQLLADPIDGLEIDCTVVSCDEHLRSSVRAGRAFARDCWRGGLGHATVYDEVLDPHALDDLMQRLNLRAALVCGGDWCHMEPALIDALAERHAESPDKLPFVFTQSAAGLSPLIINAATAHDLAAAADGGLPFVGIGAHLGYLPVQPRPDPLAKAGCVQIETGFRDRVFRCVGDASDAARSAVDLSNTDAAFDHATLSHLTIELVAQGNQSGRFAEIRGTTGDLGRGVMPTDRARAVLESFGRFAPGAAVTFAGFGDPLAHPDLLALLDAARRSGFSAVHVRTPLTGQHTTALDELIRRVDVLSIDLLADSESIYQLMHGRFGYDEAVARIERVLALRTVDRGRPHPWIVPRITRCDAVYEQVEPFHDRWLMVAGAVSIDPMPRAMEDERIEPLPRPRLAVLRDACARMTVLSDGSVPTDEREAEPSTLVSNATGSDPAGAWARVIEARRSAWCEGGHTHPALGVMW